jgi:Zn-dependent membrane protease YugP
MDVMAFYYFDPKYFMYVGPAILFALWAQWKVKSAYGRASRVPARSGLSGAETAERILDAYGIHDVGVEQVHSFLGDHYDSRHKVLRLSPDVYHGRSLASLGIAAHEVGHAIQDATAYAPLKLRNGLVPMASIGSNAAFILIILGLIMSSASKAYASIGGGLAIGGLLLFGAVVLFQLINLPVEFNASSRAREILLRHGMISPQEAPVVSKVLSAAAMTYVAATATAVLTFLYYVSLVLGRRDR